MNFVATLMVELRSKADKQLMNQFTKGHYVVLRSCGDCVCVTGWGAINDDNSAVFASTYVFCLEIADCEARRVKG